METLPKKVRIVEVGPRDGLQNEARPIPVSDKVDLVHRLAESGLSTIETGSFVSPRWVPQMAGTSEVFARIERRSQVSYTALVPNEQGLDAALAAGVSEIAIFASVTESFSKKNLNASVDETLERYQILTQRALGEQLRVRGYLSCVLGCPYEGEVSPTPVTRLTQRLLDMGCFEVSLGDTIGSGTAGSTARLLEHTLGQGVSSASLAMHCHDTWGQALANILVALQHGISVIDASVAGLGGCPYAKGATGNVATEDVVRMLDGLGIEHGIDLASLVQAGQFICGVLGKRNESRTAQAFLSTATSTA